MTRTQLTSVDSLPGTLLRDPALRHDVRALTHPGDEARVRAQRLRVPESRDVSDLGQDQEGGVHVDAP